MYAVDGGNDNFLNTQRLSKMQYKPFVQERTVHDATSTYGQYKDPLVDTLGKYLSPTHAARFNNAVNLADMGRTNFSF